jgi:hypothetical protein
MPAMWVRFRRGRPLEANDRVANGTRDRADAAFVIARDAWGGTHQAIE